MSNAGECFIRRQLNTCQQSLHALDLTKKHVCLCKSARVSAKKLWGSRINIPLQQVTHDTDQDTTGKKFPSMSNDYRVLILNNATCFFHWFFLQNACKMYHLKSVCVTCHREISIIRLISVYFLLRRKARYLLAIF
jgi:hypothetical protein